MPEMVSRKFLIYEYVPGCAQSLTECSRREKIMLKYKNQITIAAEFVYSDEIEPAVECEISINLSAMRGWSDWEISGQVQKVLMFGIGRTNGIIPRGDDCEYEFNRHGGEITSWIIRELRGKPPIGFSAR